MSANNKVSLIFPVYNEGGVIENTLRSYHDEFAGKMDFEMIVMEDGSTDSTKEILARLERDLLMMKVYSSVGRRGYLQAIKDGLRYTRYDWVFLVDSDGQFTPKDFWKLWSYIDRYDVILGEKINRKDGALRKFLSRGYNFLLRVLFNVPFKDMDTGFRLIRKNLLDMVGGKVSHLQFFNAEFVVRSYFRGAKIIEVPVSHFKRTSGRTNIFYMKKLPYFIFRELIGLLALFRELKRPSI